MQKCHLQNKAVKFGLSRLRLHFLNVELSPKLRPSLTLREYCILETDCLTDFDPCADFSQIQCSDICLVADSQPYCSCRSGYKLGADNQTCLGNIHTLHF